MVVMMLSISAAIGEGGAAYSGPTVVADIPQLYLRLYVEAARENKVDWAILAAIGKIETDHGRSTAPGVHAGVNAYGCCAGPMQFSIVGHPSTWDTYGQGGSVYDPRAAIPAAARYLVTSGAPRDYHAAVLAYNHSERYYRDVMIKAQEYRTLATAPMEGSERVGPITGPWLVPISGTAERCDARIVPNVVSILARYHATLLACYAASGHAAGGEHPLGLAVDLAPEPPASWESMADLARFAGWKTACASTGCAGQTGTAFRFVGWNYFPGHGDPAHAGANAHLHLSWDHGPGRPAEWVRVVAGG